MKRLLIILPLFMLAIISHAQAIYKNVSSVEFNKLISTGDGIILDVRTSQEYSRGHIPNSTLISTNDQNFVEKIHLLQKDKPIYIYCLSGSRSRQVARYMANKGYNKVVNLQYGLIEWQRQGYTLTEGSKPTTPTSSKSYTSAEFGKLLQSNGLVLADFHASWCAPCIKMNPIVDKLKKDYTGKVAIEKIDYSANKELMPVYNVKSIPAFILFKNGKEVWRHTGMISEEDLNKVLTTYL